MRNYELSPTVKKILKKRGFSDKEEIRDLLFTRASEIRHIETPDIDKAMDILKSNNDFVIYGDYDCDGICASAIAKLCLEGLGKRADIYINSRECGYGMQRSGVRDIFELYPDADCILTVDNGIAALDAVNYAKMLGYTILVTDHHEPGDELPCADAIVDLKRKDDTSSFKELCGAGLIWKVMMRLYEELKKDTEPVYDCLDLAALATIADVVPLLSENRAIARDGLKLIDRGERIFFYEICSLMGVDDVREGTDVAFKIAPAVNAVSRMGEDVSIVFNAIFNGDPKSIKRMVDINEERKAVTKRGVEAAKESVRQFPHLVAASGDFPDGVIGIIAGNLKEEYGLPTCVFSLDGRASLRSTDSLNIKEALDLIPKGLLQAYGGHAKAAGLTVAPGKIDEFLKALSDICDKLYKITSETTDVDLLIYDDELTEDFVTELTVLEPYGEGFPKVLLQVNCDVDDMKFMGQDKQHVKYRTTCGLSVIKWGGADAARKAGRYPESFIGTASLNAFNGNVSVQLVAQP